MEISERELRQLAGAVDEQHRDGMSTMAADIAELHAQARRLRTQTRRRVLRSVGLGLGAVTIGTSVVSFASLLPAAAQEEEQDLSEEEVAAFAETVELAAVEAYAAVGASGKLAGPLVEVGSMFAAHHAEHAAAFASAAGAKATGRANVKLVDTLSGQIAAAQDEEGVLEVAYDMENAAVGTYMFAMGTLESPAALALVASILPVESQHAIVLATAMAKPLADSIPAFETEEKALDPTKFPVNE